MEDQIYKSVELLANQLGVAVTEIVPFYSQWLFWSAFGWLLMGVFIVAGCICGIVYSVKNREKLEEFAYFLIVVCSIIGLIGAIILVAQIGDLASPQAAAYHQILRDLIPRK